MNAGRINKLEKELQVDGLDDDAYIEFRVEYYQTILDQETGERHEVLRPASGYTEGEWRPAGPGQMTRVCYSTYEGEIPN